MKTIDIFKKILYQLNISLSRSARNSNLDLFISKFKKKYLSIELVRVGSRGDGGYLIPPVLDDITSCFSPGVSDNASFELELADNKNINCFLADASVNGPPINHKNFKFTKKFLGSQNLDTFITLSDWVNEMVNIKDDSFILQMDIEGSEYEVLSYESASFLSSFRVIIIEFHNLNRLFEKDYLPFYQGIFNKLYENFFIGHAHPNNCCGSFEVDGIEIPNVMEVTFIRNDYLDMVDYEKPLNVPHQFDIKNVQGNADLLLPKVWWN